MLSCPFCGNLFIAPHRMKQEYPLSLAGKKKTDSNAVVCPQEDCDRHFYIKGGMITLNDPPPGLGGIELNA